MSLQDSYIPKIALIAASGVNEAEMTAIQRALVSNKWRAHIISPESSLVNSWAETSWGHSFAADSKIEVSLGSDFDMLIIPGGVRHVDKLAANPHTKRILTAMCALRKPVVAFADGAKLLEGHQITDGKSNVVTYDSVEALDNGTADMIAFFNANMPEQYDDEEEQQAA